MDEDYQYQQQQQQYPHRHNQEQHYYSPPTEETIDQFDENGQKVITLNTRAHYHG